MIELLLHLDRVDHFKTSIIPVLNAVTFLYLFSELNTSILLFFSIFAIGLLALFVNYWMIANAEFRKILKKKKKVDASKLTINVSKHNPMILILCINMLMSATASAFLLSALEQPISFILIALYLYLFFYVITRMLLSVPGLKYY